MNKQYLNEEFSKKISDLYRRMAKAYDQVAGRLDFSCEGCPDNCCDSFFLHHTYIEWAYLWEGLGRLSTGDLNAINERAATYILEGEKAFAKGDQPRGMCPLNEQGLCTVYPHRLMICRMHGVPSGMTRPDGRKVNFPGCFRCQEIVGNQEDGPRVDRTDLYRELAGLEAGLLGAGRQMMPRVRMTIAEMIINGPPRLAGIRQ